MANTEGLSDEAVSSLLAMPSPEEEKRTKQKAPGFPRQALSRREQMMELGEGEMPAATVIRSSRAPKIHSTSSVKMGGRTVRAAEKDVIPEQSSFATTAKTSMPDNEEKEEASGDHANKANPKPVLLSECIRERPVTGIIEGTKPLQSTTGTKPRESRFKQRSREASGLGTPTTGGFPSLEIAPVGAFTRKGRSAARVRIQESPRALEKLGSESQNSTPTATRTDAGKDVGRASDAMLANMSLEEIRDGVDEVKSILSAESIEFLKRRGRQKHAEKKGQATGGPPPIQRDIRRKQSSLTKREEIQLEEKKAHDEKEKMADLLSSVRTPEDMDRVYQEALQLGLAAELPSSSLETAADDGVNERTKNLHIATSLLRSTSPRQRMLGAKSLCDILEEDVSAFTKRRCSDSLNNRQSMQNTYPKLLPVAVRCLLDESIATYQTTGGRLLLSFVLRCIHALVILFVHPYHVVHVSPTTTGCEDPFILYQTCFMSDISHAPPGAELYPPTQIKPIDNGDANNASCYRADSSAATAESDSKAFYNDPAWTLLSRMRILPCLSDVLLCLSTDYSTGAAIPGATIQSICGVLSMLAVRSPGAASAIARHKGILPFLVSYCLSPSKVIENDQSEKKGCADDDSGLFNTGVALPALVLLCHLGRQSRDVAELDMPFGAIIPDIQAILCVEANNDKELGIQIWSLILLRILMRFGLAMEHVQSIINIAAGAAMLKPENILGAHYLRLFANICDASKIVQQDENSTNLPSIPEAEDCIAMSGVWLSSPARSCVTSLQTVVQGSSKNHVMLASAQLQMLASYISTATPTMKANSIPMISNESCLEVIDAVLESDMLGNAVDVALEASFHSNWDTCCARSHPHSQEDEAIGCSFVSSFVRFVDVVSDDDLKGALKTKMIDKIVNSLERHGSRKHSSTDAAVKGDIHPARQSWFVEAEFSVLKVLCEEGSGFEDDIWHMLSIFAFSLVGRLNMGHEAMAVFIFQQERLFKVKNIIDGTEIPCQSIPALFLGELGFCAARPSRSNQLNHSSNIFSMQPSIGPLRSLRCTTDFVGGSSDAEGERFILPLGAIWMWNVLSSAMTFQSDRPPNELVRDGQNDEMQNIISHALSLLLQVEKSMNDTLYASSILPGTKLYHLANVCLLPEAIWGSDFIALALEMLFKQISGFGCSSVRDPSLIRDFIRACFRHSRLSKESRKLTPQENEKGATEKKLHDMLNSDQVSPEGYSKGELKALDDFVDDMCNTYIEYGGTITSFTQFIRLFLRHGFPAKVVSAVLTKLHPILHVLTIDDEDREELFFSLAQSISGGLPSLDSSRRDPSGVLDSFSSLLKKRDKELSRTDYVYLLAVAILSRNLASSSQRCECGLQATKNRLSGVSDYIFYDITQVAEMFLRGGSGTKESLITCVLNICMDSKKSLMEHDDPRDWRWNTDEAAIWDRVVECLIGITPSKET